MNGEPSNASPIFIVGVPRSGTTLLSAMLSSHPRIAIAPETHFVAHDYRLQSDANLQDGRVFEQVWNRFVQGRRFGHLGVTASTIHERLIHQQRCTFSSVFFEILSAYAESVNKPRCGEKTPGHYLHLDTLFEWFPNSLVIFIFRDPRAVCASLLKAPFGNRYVSFHCKRWNEAFGILTKFRQDARLYHCRYEDLVRQPAPILEEICAHVGEDYTPAMISRAQCSTPNLRTGWGRSHVSKAIAQDLSTESIEKWKQQLSPAKVSMIEQITELGMRQLQYQAVQGERPAFTSCRVVLDRMVSRIDLGLRRQLRLALHRY